MKFPALLAACTFLFAAACGPAEQTKDETNSPPPTSTPPPTTPSTITVSGTLVDGTGQPVSGVAIAIGEATPVNTDSAGHFSIAGVKPPYELTVIDAAAKSAVVYKGLTRADPKLLHLGAGEGLFHGAVLSGYSNKASTTSESLLDLSFVSPEVGVTEVFADSSGYYYFDSTELSWKGPAATTGTLAALELVFDAAGNMPTEYKGFASQPFTLQDGGAFSKNFALSAVANRSVSGTITVAPNYTLAAHGFNLMLGGRSAFVFGEAATSSGFNFLTPAAPGMQVKIGGLAQHANGSTVYGFKSNLAIDAANVALAFPAAPDVILPADGALGVDGTMRFSWAPMSGAAHVVSFLPTTAAAPRFYVVTNATDATLPDLAKHGLAIPSQARYQWRVTGVAPYASIDAVAGDALDALLQSDSRSETFVGYSAFRGFVAR